MRVIRLWAVARLVKKSLYISWFMMPKRDTVDNDAPFAAGSGASSFIENKDYETWAILRYRGMQTCVLVSVSRLWLFRRNVTS